MILNMDCRHGLAMLPDNSVDALITDPPYELGFMGNAWDRSGIANDVALWRDALRVLKPGGHILAFSGSRTYHRMATAIEDAGAEIRDSIMWVYGSGFPKSLDISKALDKMYGAERQIVGKQYRTSTGRNEGYGFDESFDITAPTTLAAQIWAGWGTGLKPAHEPICVARKPLGADTVAANVMAYGVGGININACRVAVDPVADASQLRTMNVSQHDGSDGWGMNTTAPKEGARVLGLEGRWPANFIHDGSPEVLAHYKGASENARFYKQCEWVQDDLEAALFYYCAKASKRDKGCDNNHPTVKPTELMRYLCRLVCPPGGLILDIFAGSGSTGKAAKSEGFQFMGFELDPEFTALANARLMA